MAWLPPLPMLGEGGWGGEGQGQRCEFFRLAAKVPHVEPFILQSVYETTKYTQDVTLGIDAGYQTVAFSAIDVQIMFFRPGTLRVRTQAVSRSDDASLLGDLNN